MYLGYVWGRGKLNLTPACIQARDMYRLQHYPWSHKERARALPPGNNGVPVVSASTLLGVPLMIYTALTPTRSAQCMHRSALPLHTTVRSFGPLVCACQVANVHGYKASSSFWNSNEATIERCVFRSSSGGHACIMRAKPPREHTAR